MSKKRVILIVYCVAVCFAAVFGISQYKKAKAESLPDEVIAKIEKAMGDDFKKQSMTELVATLEYGDQNNEENKIYYRILKTTFYEGDPAEVTGLHTQALEVLFPVDYMDSCEEMKIQEWDGALYKKGETAYLCWTYSPEVTYVLEYNPKLLDDAEIIKMAESAKPVE